jgi:hypothetical protein
MATIEIVEQETDRDVAALRRVWESDKAATLATGKALFELRARYAQQGYHGNQHGDCQMAASRNESNFKAVYAEVGIPERTVFNRIAKYEESVGLRNATFHPAKYWLDAQERLRQAVIEEHNRIRKAGLNPYAMPANKWERWFEFQTWGVLEVYGVLAKGHTALEFEEEMRFYCDHMTDKDFRLMDQICQVYQVPSWR